MFISGVEPVQRFCLTRHINLNAVAIAESR